MAAQVLDQPKKVKATTRTGRRIGRKNRATVSITLNDPYRQVSGMWELLKLHFSRERMTAAELGNMVFMRGAVAILEEIELRAHNEDKERLEAQQERFC